MTAYGDQNYIYLDLDFIGELVLSHCLLFTALYLAVYSFKNILDHK